MNEMVLLYIVCGGQAEAEAISRALLAERLTACANLHPISSLYCWQGETVSEGEVVLLAKTLRHPALLSLIEERVRALHSYAIPCIMQLPVAQVNADYLRWIVEQVAAAQ